MNFNMFMKIFLTVKNLSAHITNISNNMRIFFETIFSLIDKNRFFLAYGALVNFLYVRVGFDAIMHERLMAFQSFSSFKPLEMKYK